MPKLSLAALTSGKPGHYPDAAVEGLRYRVHPNGRVYAEIRYKAHGGRWTAQHLGRLNVEDRLADLLDDHHPDNERPPSPTLEDVLEPVREAAKALRREVRQGNVPGGADTLGALVERFLRHAKVRPATLYEWERYLRRDWALLHPRPVAALTRREIADHLLRLREAKAPRGTVAVNRARSALSACLSWAAKQGLVEHNAARDTLVEREASRDRVLSLAELRELWAVAGEPGLPEAYRAIVRLLMLTGQRRAEVGGMRWSEIDLEAALWRLPGSRTKNGRPHVVPLSEPAVALLRGLPREGDFVFGEAQGYVNWSQSKARLDARLALPSWTLHDIRRSVVTGMAELGIEPHVIEALANHISGRGKVAGIYNRATYAEPKARAVALWAARLLEAEPARVVPLRRA